MAGRSEERETFVAHLVRAYPTLPVGRIVHTARALMASAATYGRLAVEDCNGVRPEREERHRFETGACERRLQRIVARLAEPDPADVAWPAPVLNLGGDPRGYTVKLLLHNRAYNTMGGAEEGFGVPGS